MGACASAPEADANAAKVRPRGAPNPRGLDPAPTRSMFNNHAARAFNNAPPAASSNDPHPAPSCVRQDLGQDCFS